MAVKSSSNSLQYESGKNNAAKNKQFTHKEIEIEELRKQQEELVKMQELIAKQMMTIQKAIQIQEYKVKPSNHRHKRSVEFVDESNTHTLNNVKATAVIGYNNSQNEDIEKHEASLVSVSDYNNYNTTSSAMHSRQRYQNEKSVPLFKSAIERPKSSINTKRRTRDQRERDMSAEKYSMSSICKRKSVVASTRKNINHGAYFSTTFGKNMPTTTKNQPVRAAFCSKERKSFVDNTIISTTNKSAQLEK